MPLASNMRSTASTVLMRRLPTFAPLLQHACPPPLSITHAVHPCVIQVLLEASWQLTRYLNQIGAVRDSQLCVVIFPTLKVRWLPLARY